MPSKAASLAWKECSETQGVRVWQETASNPLSRGLHFSDTVPSMSLGVLLLGLCCLVTDSDNATDASCTLMVQSPPLQEVHCGDDLDWTNMWDENLKVLMAFQVLRRKRLHSTSKSFLKRELSHHWSLRCSTYPGIISTGAIN